MDSPESTCYLADGMVAKPPGPPCSTFNLLIPFVVSGVVGIPIHLLLGRRNARNQIRWWNSSYLDKETVNGRWTPWSAVGSTLFAVIVAAVSAVLIRVSGLHVDIFSTTLLWLTRPRIAWVAIMLQLCFHGALAETATDLLFQEALLGVLAIPGAVRMLISIMNDTCGGFYSDAMRRSSVFYQAGVAGVISCGAIFLFVGVAMLLKPRFLNSLSAALAAVSTCGAFICSWLLWVGFTYVGSEGGFCYGNLAGVALLQVALPVTNSLLRSWIGHPGR